MKIIFDIGGTNMRFSSIVDGKLGVVLKKNTSQDLEAAKRSIVDVIKELSKEEKIESIMGGFPGTIKDGIIISAHNLPGWNDFSFAKFLQENFCKDISIYNDADLAGLGESLYGAGRGGEIVAYIGLGTGIGGVRVVDGKIDVNRLGFEPGHHILDVANEKTFGDLVSGRGILETFKKPAEAIGQAELQKLLPILAAGLYNVVRFWSPDVLVVGGSLLNEETAFKIKDIKNALKEIKTKMILPEIKKAELGDNSGLYGALIMTERISVPDRACSF